MNLLEMYFNPSGRINRSTYWQQGILLLNVIWGLSVAVVIVIALVSIGTNVDRLLDDILWDPGNYILLIFFIVILVAIYWWNNFAIAVKRLHDRDKSAWWLVLWWAISGIGGALTFGIASFVVAVWMLVELGFLEGTRGPNRYDDSGGYTYRIVEVRFRKSVRLCYRGWVAQGRGVGRDEELAHTVVCSYRRTP